MSEITAITWIEREEIGFDEIEVTGTIIPGSRGTWRDADGSGCPDGLPSVTDVTAFLADGAELELTGEEMDRAVAAILEAGGQV